MFYTRTIRTFTIIKSNLLIVRRNENVRRDFRGHKQIGNQRNICLQPDTQPFQFNNDIRWNHKGTYAGNEQQQPEKITQRKTVRRTLIQLHEPLHLGQNLNHPVAAGPRVPAHLSFQDVFPDIFDQQLVGITGAIDDGQLALPQVEGFGEFLIQLQRIRFRSIELHERVCTSITCVMSYNLELRAEIFSSALGCDDIVFTMDSRICSWTLAMSSLSSSSRRKTPMYGA